jgi:hypothetical protein
MFKILNFSRAGFVIAALSGSVLTGAIVSHVGNYDAYPTTWTAVNGLNDARDGGATTDFIGDTANPGFFWADNGDYIFFRFRVDVPTATTSTFRDSHIILIDVQGYLYGSGFGTDTPHSPDYGFAWDSKSNDITAHGLEMMVPSILGATWKATKMDDIDGQNAQKGINDINGLGRTTDGYIRSIDGQATTNLGVTTFIDFAVSWSYLNTYTDLTQGQTWNITLGSIANATDHNLLTADVAGGANPSSLITQGWDSVTATPEPQAALMLGIFGLLIAGYRGFYHRKGVVNRG